MTVWALVLWCGSLERDILKYDSIKFKENGDASAKWKNKFYSVKVLRTSEDKGWLDSLDVDTDGNVLVPDAQNISREKKKPDDLAAADSQIAKKALATSKLQEEQSIFRSQNILGDVTANINLSNREDSDDSSGLSSRGYSPVREVVVRNRNNGSKSRVVRAQIEYDKQNGNSSFGCEVCKTLHGGFARGIKLCEELQTLFRQKFNQLHAVNPKLPPLSQSMILSPQNSKSATKSYDLHIPDIETSNHHSGLKRSKNACSSSLSLSTEPKNTSNRKRFKPSGPEHPEKFLVSNRPKFSQEFAKDAGLNSIIPISSSPDKSPPPRPIPSPETFPSPIPPGNQTETSQDCKNSSNNDHNRSHDQTSTRKDDPKYNWNISSAKKVELLPNSDIYLTKLDLDHIKGKYRLNSSEMARRLFKAIIGEDRLSTMSRTGGNGWQPLPLDVNQTVYEFVKANSKPSLRYEKYERIVTQMFTSIRRPNTMPPKCADNSERLKKSSSSTSQQLSQIQAPKPSHRHSQVVTQKSPEHHSKIPTSKSTRRQPQTLTSESTHRQLQTLAPKSPHHSKQILTPKSTHRQPQTPKSSRHRSQILTPKSTHRQPQTLTPKSTHRQPQIPTPKSSHHRSQILTPKSTHRQLQTPKSSHHRSQILTPKSTHRKLQTLVSKSPYHRSQILTPKSTHRQSQTPTPKSYHHRSPILTPNSTHRQLQTLAPKSPHHRSQILTPKSSHGSKPSVPATNQSSEHSSGRSRYRSRHRSSNDRQIDHHSRKSSHNRQFTDNHYRSRERSRSRSQYSRSSNRSYRKS